jgi:plasmid stability protein
MATLTIRKLSPEVVERLKARAILQGHSMEQEARDLLTYRLAAREAVLNDIQTFWNRLEPPAEDEVTGWIQEARAGRR